jgi:LDH2 family malate/lactate/ureidoglycolate dehydrogenase
MARPEAEMPLLRPAPLTVWIDAILAAAGAAGETACHVARLLVDADLSGHAADGVARLPQYISAIEAGLLDPRAAPRVLREAPAGIALSGGSGFGEMTLSVAGAAAGAAAQSQGVALVTVCDTHGVGRLRPFVEELAAADMAALLVANGEGTASEVIPWGGTRPQLGNNALALGVPRGQGRTLVLELSTASDQPQAELLEGLLHFGGCAAHKGYGLGLIIEILAGAMAGAGGAGGKRHAGAGAALLAVAIEHFTTPEVFKEEVEGLLGFAQTGSPSVPRDQPIWAGQHDDQRRERRREAGVPLARSTLELLQECARHLGLSDQHADWRHTRMSA